VKLLREYVQVRLDLTQHILRSKESAAAIAQSRALQEALWQQVKGDRRARHRNGPDRVLYPDAERDV